MTRDISESIRAAGLGVGRLLTGFWRWTRGGHHGDCLWGLRHREWLWPLARLNGLLPVSFKSCVCSSAPGGPTLGHLNNVDTGIPIRQDCACPVAVRSVPWIVYSLVLAAVLLPVSMMAPFKDQQSAHAGRTSLRMTTKQDEIVTFIDIMSVSASTTICFLQASFSQSSLFEMIDQLQQVDRLLVMRPPAVPGVLALWLALLVVVMILDGTMWTQTNQGLMYSSIYFPFYGLYLNTFIMEVLFIDEAHNIHLRFRALNQKLEATLALPSYQAATKQPPPAPVIATDRGWVGSVSRSQAMSIQSIPDLADHPLYSTKNNIINDGKGRIRPRAALASLGALQPAPTPDLSLSIQRLNMAHHLLCQSTVSVARRHGLSLLGDILCLLLHLVITAYFFFKYLFVTKLSTQNQAVTSHYILMQACWLVVHLTRMLLLVLPCSRASAESSRTGALVGVILSTSTPSTIVHKQLETFSVQLLHHRVSFNACGMFDLGLPLVVSILGAVTTYLVVLLQIKSPAEVTVQGNATTSVTV